MNQNNAKGGSGSPAGFLFLGNQLTLDLLNTHPALTGEPTELLTDFRMLLKWFEESGLLSRSETAALYRKWNGSVQAEVTLGTIRALRETLRMEVLRWERGGKIQRAVVQQLNILMARHPMRTRVAQLENHLITQTWFEAREPEDLLAPLAQSAAELFSAVDRTRVRKCAHCGGHFLDTSKKGTRRWCSMKLCGNRFKVAAYADRQRRLPK
jgi:predicted RNA-binding Zn ribbon-like protein